MQNAEKPKYLLLFTTNSGDWDGVKHYRAVFEANSAYHSGRIAKRFIEWKKANYTGDVWVSALLPFDPIGNFPSLMKYYEKLPEEFAGYNFKSI